MNTAICFAGTGRSIKYSFENIKRFLIDDIKNSDVIAYLAKSSRSSDVIKNYLGKLDNTNVDVFDEKPIDINGYKFMNGWPPSTPNDLNIGRQNFFQMLRSKSILINLINDCEKKLNKSYDRIIFSRMDVIYEKPVSSIIEPLDLSSGTIWIPLFHNWLQGYNDRFAVSNRDGIEKYFSLYDNIEKYMKDGHEFQAERTLKYHLDKVGAKVQKFEILFARMRSDGAQHESFKDLYYEK